MNETNIYGSTAKEIEETRASLTEYLAMGGPKDYAHYREVVGKISALDKVSQHLREIEKHLLED